MSILTKRDDKRNTKSYSSYRISLNSVADIMFNNSDSYYLGFYYDYDNLKKACEKAEKLDRGYCSSKQYKKIRIKAFKDILILITDLKNKNEIDINTFNLISNAIEEKIERKLR